MPFTPIADTVKLELVMHDSGTLQPIVNVLHVGLADADQDQTHISGIAAKVRDTMTGTVLNPWSHETVFDYVRAVGLQLVDSPSARADFAPGTIGAGDDGAPPGVCALVKLLSTERSRHGRGRMYLGLIPADKLLVGGSINTALQTAVNNTMSAIRTALGTLTPACDLVVASRALGINFPLLSASCEVLTAYQRRRGMR